MRSSRGPRQIRDRPGSIRSETEGDAGVAKKSWALSEAEVRRGQGRGGDLRYEFPACDSLDRTDANVLSAWLAHA